MNNNPFHFADYGGQEYFCDRVQETESLINNIENGRNTTLISPRKYGKTGLILHTFATIKKNKPEYECVYVDIFATRNLEDFLNTLSEAILKKFHERTTIGQKLKTLLMSMRAIFSWDQLTGVPQIQMGFQLDSEKTRTLENLLEILEKAPQPIVLAIDEFQQIANYTDCNMEALLRGHIQFMHNVRFIFSGSQQSIMTEMFLSPKRPFFASTTFLSVEKIDMMTYLEFIKHHFEANGIQVEDNAVEHILLWTKRHTFYTQYICNQIFLKNPQIVNMEIVNEACDEALKIYTPSFIQYEALLTDVQIKMLIAIAKEDTISTPTAAAFLHKYNINGTSTARRTLKSLIDKELILAIPQKGQMEYQVYDLFFSRWLSREF